MTSLTLGSQLKITRAGVPSAVTTPPTSQTNEPGIITLDDGRKFEVKLMMQIGGADGKKHDVDLAKIRDEVSEDYLKNLVLRHIAIYEAVAPSAGKPLSFTVHFTQHIPNESLLSSTIGNIFTRFKDDPTTLIELKFKKLEYQTASGSKKVFDLEKEEFDDEKTARMVNMIVGGIAPLSTHIFSNPAPYISKPKKTPLKSQAELGSEKLAAIERVLNVTDNTGAGNRCLTLSVASILLKEHGGNLQAAAAEFNIALEPKVGETLQTTLSNGLIELAARTIESDDRFITPEPNQLFSNIVASLNDANQTIADPNNRIAIAKQYADLIRRSGEMLDAPIFDALSMHGIPFIVLVPSPAQDDLILGSASETISFDTEEKRVENYDLTTICFVVRKGLHYKAVIMGDTPNVTQLEKLRLVIKNDMNKTLGQIQNLISDAQKTSAQKSAEFNNLVTYVITNYHFDAKPIIIQMLRDSRRTIDNDLISKENNIFIEGASLAFLKNPAPKNKEVG